MSSSHAQQQKVHETVPYRKFTVAPSRKPQAARRYLCSDRRDLSEHYASKFKPLFLEFGPNGKVKVGCDGLLISDASLLLLHYMIMVINTNGDEDAEDGGNRYV